MPWYTLSFHYRRCFIRVKQGGGFWGRPQAFDSIPLDGIERSTLQARNPLPNKKRIFQKIPKVGGRRFPKGKADWLAAQGAGNQPRGCGMPAFLNRNERRNAATIEVAERPESPLVAPAGAKSPAKQKRTSKRCQKYGGRRFPKDDRKALWSRPQARNLLQNKNEPSKDAKSMGPKESRGRPESPLVASAEAKPSAKQRK